MAFLHLQLLSAHLGCISCRWYIYQNVSVYGKVLLKRRGNPGLPEMISMLTKDPLGRTRGSGQGAAVLVSCQDFIPKERHWLLWGNHNGRTAGAKGICSYSGYTGINKGIAMAMWMAEKQFLEVCTWTQGGEKHFRTDQCTLLVCSGWVSPLLASKLMGLLSI